MKISVKVSLAAALVLLLTLVGLSTSQITQLRQALWQQASADIQEVSGSLAIQIENWLGAKLSLINLVQQSLDRDFSQAKLMHELTNPMLEEHFLLMFGANKAGQPIRGLLTWQPAADYDATHRGWFSQALTAKNALLTEPYADATTGDLLISAVAPITNKGVVVGAFGGDLALESVAKAVNTLDFNGTGYAYLLSAEGKIISHPKTEFNGKSLQDLFTTKPPALNSQLTEAQVEGVTSLVSFTPVKNLNGADWLIGVVANKSLVMAEANKLTQQALVLTLLAVAISMALLYFLTKTLLRPLQGLYLSLKEINSGEGDLTKRLPINSKDEIGLVAEEFNGFLAGLQKLISQILTSSSEVRNSTDATAAGAEQSANQLAVQLEELDQLATAMQEMSATADEVARNSQGAAEEARAANTESERGYQVVTASTQAINQLATEMDTTSQAVNNLANLSESIENILATINGIAEQTNLLALNAAIEAARAGESGRGFAVVADEVRSLAARTQEATLEIGQMIEELQTGVKQVEATMLASKNSASSTAENATQANTALESIKEAVNSINEMNVQIATAAEEQSATTEEINRNTTNIRDISQQLAEVAQQQVNQCQAMVNQVAGQRELLKRFKV